MLPATALRYVASVVVQLDAWPDASMLVAIYQDAMPHVARDCYVARYVGVQCDKVTIAVDVDTCNTGTAAGTQNSEDQQHGTLQEHALCAMAAVTGGSCMEDFPADVTLDMS
jgi:hypothetical protein